MHKFQNEPLASTSWKVCMFPLGYLLKAHCLWWIIGNCQHSWMGQLASYSPHSGHALWCSWLQQMSQVGLITAVIELETRMDLGEHVPTPSAIEVIHTKYIITYFITQWWKIFCSLWVKVTFSSDIKIVINLPNSVYTVLSYTPFLFSKCILRCKIVGPERKNCFKWHTRSRDVSPAELVHNRGV